MLSRKVGPRPSPFVGCGADQLCEGTQPRFIPAAPTSSRLSLLTALRTAHQELLTPPPIVSCDPARLARWSPRLRKDVDWDSVASEYVVVPQTEAEKEALKLDKKARRNKKKDVYVQRMKKPVAGEEVVLEEAPPPEEEAIEVEVEREVLTGDDAHPYLTIGLIGESHHTILNSHSY